MKRTGLLLTLALLPMIALAQGAKIKMPNFDGLSRKASKTVDISLDKDMLQTAGAFMGGGQGQSDAEFQELVKGLDGLYVRVFNFEKAEQYSMRDIEAVIDQVEKGGWKKLLSVREKGEHVEMWMRDNAADGGMFFVAAKPTELVLINIAGNVNLEAMRKLQGRMGVPNLPAVAPAPPAPPTKN
jgi:Domain of unknown function (DUF4252)